jgi:integrase
MDQPPRLCRVAGRDTWHIYHKRRRISTGCTDRTQAERVLAQYLAGGSLPSAGTATSIADNLTAYLADRVDRGKPGAERLRWAHKPLTRHLGTMPAEQIDPAVCRSYARHRAAEGVSAVTTRTELQALRAALRWRLGEAAPKIELPPRGQPRDRWLTRAEADKLIAGASGHHVRLFIMLALHTAARRGAILGLTWDRVDLDARRIDYNEPGRERTKKRRARPPINDTLLAALTEAKASAETNFVIEWAGGRVESVKRGFRSATARAGLADVTPHTLRHTAVTWMMQAGVPVWEAAGFAAMTAQMVQEVYGHHHPDHMAGAAKALG